MIKYELIHPALLGALAQSGHGTQILIADGNYPHNTGGNRDAVRVPLNLRPGLLTVDQILEVLLTAVPIEAAAVMSPPSGEDPPAIQGYRALLGPEVPLSAFPR
ncbi:MAG: RbsD or FucU transport, partial [Micrococcaceae bacterium]|nr:RbsD or FucU transport [Micrococcaceae bacterium]